MRDEQVAGEDWALTSIVEFEDRFEGQVFHVGTEDDCRHAASLIDAICYSGDGKILSSSLKWLPASKMGLNVGQTWRLVKDASA